MPRRHRTLTAEEEQVIRREIAAGATDRDAATTAGVSARRLYAARLHELRDLPRQKRGPRPGRVYPPVPDFVDLPVDEIYRRAAELRTGWTEEERQARWNAGFSGEAPS